MSEILQYLNYLGEIFSFGNSSDKEKGRLIANYNEELYHFEIDNYYVCFDGKKIIKVFDFSKR